MKIDMKIVKEAEKLVEKFIKAHAEKDKEGKLTGNNPVLTVSSPNLFKFLKSDEFFQVGKIPIPNSLKRPSEKREFHKKLKLIAKHYFKGRMDRKEYNEEFERDPMIMVKNYEEYRRIIEEEDGA